MDRLITIAQQLRASGVRLTPQRQLVIRRALAKLHFTAEELVADVRRIDDSVARGTVYRTLRVLKDAHILEKHDFHAGPPYYEVTSGKAHHDHLLCTRCGEIIEFQEPNIERLQMELAARYGYKLLSHNHKLYGLCRKCQKRGPCAHPGHPHLHVEQIIV